MKKINIKFLAFRNFNTTFSRLKYSIVKMQVNRTLAQFQFALGHSGHLANLGPPMGDSKRDINRACEKIIDPNCKVLATKYLQLHNAQLIGNTALHIAASKKNLYAFKFLLKLGTDYTMKNHHSSTVLHQIIESQKRSISEACSLDDTFVRMILSAHLKDCNFENPLNDNGLSHFHIACAFNDVELVKAFIQNGISVNHTVKENCHLFPGFTPVHFAARFCASEVLEMLLSHGANLNIKDIKGMTPLHLALEQKLKIISKFSLDEALRVKNELILILLLKKEIDNDMMVVNNWGLSHLHVACTFNDSKEAKSYLQKVCNINHAVNVNSPVWSGYTALHFAALCNIDTVKLLMKKGADISIKDTKEVTAFDICIERYKIEDIYALLSLHPIWKKIMLSDGKTRLPDLVFSMRNLRQFNLFLKKFSINFKICSDSSLWPGFTPMHLAVLFTKELPINTSNNSEETDVQILRSLCEKDPSMLESQDVRGYTPLHLAYYLNKNSTLEVLLSFLESYPNLTNPLDEDGLSFLHIAAAKKNISFLERVLSTGCDVNAAFQGRSLISRTIFPGSTALHFAVVNGRSDAVEILMNHGADAYAKDANDMTPIHLLLFNPEAGNLLDAPNLKDSVARSTGLSHLHVASWCGHSEIVDRLLDDGANIDGIVTYREDPIGLSFLQKYAGLSPLAIAYQEECYYAMLLLVRRGADIFVENTEGEPLLYRVLDMEDDCGLVEIFLNALEKNDDMQARLRADTGMTTLHVACLLSNVESVEALIKGGADVNAQVPLDSPIFREFTPLHMSLYPSTIYDMEKVIEALVKGGADVTLPNATSQTAVHLAYKMCNDNSEDLYSYINTILEAQRDFSLNPVDVDGVSHFHIACRIFNPSVVQKFLKYANIDINQPVDCFIEVEPGSAALHFAASNLSGLGTFSKHLETVDLLLKHGVDVDVEDAYGDTPLFDCLRMNYEKSNSLDIFERIARAGADVNARNLDGNTPFNYYLNSNDVTYDGLKTLLRLGCCINMFNTITNQGYMAKVLSITSFPIQDLTKLLSVLTTTFKQEIATDNLGRTAIHNIVSGDKSTISADVYVSYIDQLCKTGIAVDDQDSSDRTALHLAASFYNVEGVAGLVMAGADINISDINGQTAYADAFTYDAHTCIHCRTDNKNIDLSQDGKCVRIEILKTLAIYVKKLQFCGLDVNKQNKDYASKTVEELKNEKLLNEDISKELAIVKKITIGSQKLALSAFLSETGAVVNYQRMPLIKRDAINEFFSLHEAQSLRTMFPELAGILQLQYRKARARPRLTELARIALAVLVGFRMPEICSDYIFILLSNLELKSLIASTK